MGLEKSGTDSFLLSDKEIYVWIWSGMRQGSPPHTSLGPHQSWSWNPLFSDISPPLCELRAVPLFPTGGTQRGGLTEIPFLRSPKGTAFSHRAGTENHPKGVIFRTENDGEGTYMGTLTHAGIIQQGPFPRDLDSGPGVVSGGGLYEISEIGRHAGR